jgi:hypothetical protein
MRKRVIVTKTNPKNKKRLKIKKRNFIEKVLAKNKKEPNSLEVIEFKIKNPPLD